MNEIKKYRIYINFIFDGKSLYSDSSAVTFAVIRPEIRTYQGDTFDSLWDFVASQSCPLYARPCVLRERGIFNCGRIISFLKCPTRDWHENHKKKHKWRMVIEYVREL